MQQDGTLREQLRRGRPAFDENRDKYWQFSVDSKFAPDAIRDLCVEMYPDFAYNCFYKNTYYEVDIYKPSMNNQKNKFLLFQDETDNFTATFADGSKHDGELLDHSRL
jgi:hypothetical protein